MSEWKTVTLGDLISIRYGKDHKQIGDGNIPIYGSGGIMRYGDKALYTKPSVLIPRKGSLNNILFVENPFWTVDTMFWTEINTEKVLPKFLFYNICKFDFASYDVGSAVPSLSVPIIEGIDLSIPSLCTQQKIADILSSLDDKIETNRAINARLEELAAAIFKSWFINESNAEELTTIGKYLIPKRGKNLLTKDARGGEIPVVAGGLEPSCYHDEANTKSPVITISASGANAGFVNIWSRPVWSADSSYIDMSITPFVYFWYNLLKNRQKEIYDSQTGSAQPHIYPYHISALSIKKLDMAKVEKYNMLVSPFFERIETNLKENKKLASLRDTLLPRLMSGEIKPE